jgi:acyl transferase domain-containing protein
LLGIAKVLAAAKVDRKRSCGVTSFKSVVGHTKAAAGIGAFIKAVIAVNQRVLPPTAGCSWPHDVFSQDGNSLYPIVRGSILPHDREVRAGVSAMGFGGINVHVTLASADPAQAALKPSVGERIALASAQDSEVFCLSAASERELLSRVTQLRADAQGASLAELVFW